MNVQEIQERLKEGNKRYVEDKENPTSDQGLRSSLTGGQQPFARFLAAAPAAARRYCCDCDSRPPGGSLGAW